MSLHLKNLPRNLLVLAAAQALFMGASPLNTLIGGIVGSRIAPTPALSTLPVALMIVGLALSTVPAARYMERVGRRRGFMTGAAIAVGAALMAAMAITRENFWMFCAATLVLGSNLAFVQQYRFAAAESVKPAQVPKAVSIVLLGTLVAAWLGPQLGKMAEPAMGIGREAMAYILLAVVLAIGMLLLAKLKDVKPVEHSTAPGHEARSLREVFGQRGFLIAVLAASCGYGVMSFLMTATPISMHVKDGFSLDNTALVIQSHIAAMYLPSLFSGVLIRKLGEPLLMLTGIAALGICIAIGFLGHEFHHYWFTLVLLGIGWNFLFVSATTLLTKQYRASERYRAQAANDFTVFSITAAASLLSGTAIEYLGWEGLLTVSIVPLVLLTVMLLVNWSKLREPAVAG